MEIRTILLVAAAGLAVSGCATGTSPRSASDGDMAGLLGAMLSGESRMKGSALEKEIAKADAHPLGSEENPVRASMPPGQRAYLSRLRCANLKAPSFRRLGSAGVSRYDNIMDVYLVKCEDSDPAESRIYMDMYHAGHVEERAVPGFGIVGGRSE